MSVFAEEQGQPGALGPVFLLHTNRGLGVRDLAFRTALNDEG